jgi:hypothetical protein
MTEPGTTRSVVGKEMPGARQRGRHPLHSSFGKLRMNG